MVQNQIRSLFLLFAGEEELPDAVQPVLDEAVLEVQQALKDGADEDDARLNWLAAPLKGHPKGVPCAELAVRSTD